MWLCQRLLSNKGLVKSPNGNGSATAKYGGILAPRLQELCEAMLSSLFQGSDLRKKLEFLLTVDFGAVN
jgi:hypothetical protein